MLVNDEVVERKGREMKAMSKREDGVGTSVESITTSWRSGRGPPAHFLYVDLFRKCVRVKCLRQSPRHGLVPKQYAPERAPCAFSWRTAPQNLSDARGEECSDGRVRTMLLLVSTSVALALMLSLRSKPTAPTLGSLLSDETSTAPPE